MQVLALEERNDHLESEIALLRSKTSNKAKSFNTNNKGFVKGAPSKNSLPLPAKSLPHSSTVHPTDIGNSMSNLQATEHTVAQSTPSPYFEQWCPSPHSTYDSDFQQSINEEYLALLDTSAGDEIPNTADEVKEAI